MKDQNSGWVKTSAYSIRRDDIHIARSVVNGKDVFQVWNGHALIRRTFANAEDAKMAADLLGVWG